MTEPFKRKLEAYRDGTLSEKERAEVEQELEKLETYQIYLDELMNEDGGEPGESGTEGADVLKKNIVSERKPGDRKQGRYERKPDDDQERQRDRRERRIMRRAKWKSRGVTALITLIVLGAVWGGSHLFTQYYYTKRDVGPTGQALREVNQQALRLIVDTTLPNRSLALDLQDPGVFFNMDIEGTVQHMLGSSAQSEKKISQSYVFGRITDTRIEGQNNQMSLYAQDLAQTDKGYFWLPGGSNRKQEEVQNLASWQALSELPKLTVSELYISFNKEYVQTTLKAQFKGLRVAPQWFAVRSGQEWADSSSYTIMDEEGSAKPAKPEDYLNLIVQNPIGGDANIGLGYMPVREETNEEYKKYRFLSWKTGMIEALTRIAQSPEVAESVTDIDFASAAAEVEKNGAKVYGVVVTGRSEELAKLQDEPWMQGAIVRLGDSVLDTQQFEPYIAN